MTDAPAIRFELRFTRASGADAAAEPRERGRGTDEARHEVLELRQLDLHLAFARARAAGEDVENELGAIEDGLMRLAFEISKLGGRQLVVEDDQIGAGLVAGGAQQLDLPRTEKRGRVGLGTLLQKAEHDLGARRIGETFELREALLGLRASAGRRHEPDQRGTLRPGTGDRFCRSRTGIFAPNTHFCSDSSTRSHATTPARIRRGVSEVTSTIVDGAPGHRRRAAVDQHGDVVAQRAHARRPRSRRAADPSDWRWWT